MINEPKTALPWFTTRGWVKKWVSSGANLEGTTLWLWEQRLHSPAVCTCCYWDAATRVFIRYVRIILKYYSCKATLVESKNTNIDWKRAERNYLIFDHALCRKSSQNKKKLKSFCSIEAEKETFVYSSSLISKCLPKCTFLLSNFVWEHCSWCCNINRNWQDFIWDHLNWPI